MRPRSWLEMTLCDRHLVQAFHCSPQRCTIDLGLRGQVHCSASLRSLSFLSPSSCTRSVPQILVRRNIADVSIVWRTTPQEEQVRPQRLLNFLDKSYSNTTDGEWSWRKLGGGGVRCTVYMEVRVLVLQDWPLRLIRTEYRFTQARVEEPAA